MDALSGIGNFFKNNYKTVVPAALAGTGFLSNYLNARKYNSRSDFINDLIKDPNKFNAYVRSFERPLNAGLTQSVGNQVQAYLGERGLSQTPGITSDVLAQALAPFVQQNQSRAVAEAENNLGLLGSLGVPPQSNIAPALSLLLSKPIQYPTLTPSTTSSGGGGLTQQDVNNLGGFVDSTFPSTAVPGNIFDTNSLLDLFGAGTQPA